MKHEYFNVNQLYNIYSHINTPIKCPQLQIIINIY